MRRSAVLLALVVVACGAGSPSSDADGRPTTPGATSSCPDGFALDAAAQACMEIAPDDCGAGTAPFLGSKECTPVGWSCAPPYETDPSGWGCRPTIAPACVSSTIETFGSATCAQVDDCSAPFPPANATYIVDATLATEDATHFKSIFDAVGASNKGDVVAIMPGTYVEDVDVVRDDITIVGKCATQVTIKNPGDKRAGFLVKAHGAKISGVTLTGHMDGVLVMSGGDATLERAIVLSNRYQGVYVAENGSHLAVKHTRIQDVVPDGGKFGWGAAAQLGGSLELEDVVIDAATSYGIGSSNAGSKVSIKNVVVRNTRAGDNDPVATGLGVGDAEASVDGLFIDGAQALAVYVSNSKLTAKHLVAVGTKSTPQEPGRTLQVSMGAHVDLSESFLSKSDDANVLVVGKGSTAKVTSSVVTQAGSHGIQVAQGASIDLSTSALVGNSEVGFSVQDPGTRATATNILVRDTRGTTHLGIGVGVGWAAVLDMKHSALEKNTAAGVLVSQLDGAPPIANITSTLIRRTNPDKNGIGDGIQASGGGVANLDGCALVENMQVSALVGHGGSQMTIKSSLFRDTRQPEPNMFGHALIADDGGSLVVDGSWILSHPGVGVAVSNGAATVARSLVAKCAVAVHVQDGSELQVADTVPDAPESAQVVISNDTRFVDDETRIGSGSIPMPAPLGAAPRTKN